MGEKWRRLKGIGTLDKRKLAIARELFLWREKKAIDLNRPARVLVRDDLLVEVARKNPKHSRDLAVVRGLAHKFLDEIYVAIEQGRSLPLEECPEVVERDIDPPQVTLALNLLLAFMGDYSARHHVAPNLVASNSDLKAIIRAMWAGDVSQARTLLLEGWRAKAVLPELLEVLEGKRWLRLADLKSETPFEFR